MVIDTSDDGPAMWSFVVRHHLEGLVAKLHTSLYRAGRDAVWVKIKRVRRATILITGWEAGAGSRSTGVGAMVMSLLGPDGSLVEVGRVGSGLRDADHKPLVKTLMSGAHFIAEVSYLSVTATGQVRQPVWKGVRTDVGREACTLAQLAE